MNDAEHRPISDYERAVCYYALSGQSANVTLALILVYGLCILEAAAALTYGLISGDRTWTVIGMTALAGMIVFGIVVFSARALVTEIRRRRTLAIAKQAPDPEALKELPDPFADHILLRRPADENAGFEITDRDGQTLYRVETEGDRRHRRVLDAEGKEVIEVRIPAQAGSFALEGMLPRRVDIYSEKQPAGRIRQRFTLGPHVADIHDDRAAEQKHLVLQGGGVLHGNRLIGRIYLLRDHVYLDLERAALGNALLGLFVALSYDKAQAPLL